MVCEASQMFTKHYVTSLQTTESRRQKADDSNRSKETKRFAMPRLIVCSSLVLMVDDPNRLIRIPFLHDQSKIYDLHQGFRKSQAKAKDVDSGYSVELF